MMTLISLASLRAAVRSTVRRAAPAVFALALAAPVACAQAPAKKADARKASQPAMTPATPATPAPMASPSTATTPARATTTPAVAQSATAVFGSGCFWCTESDFEKVSGVLDAVSGYTGGRSTKPTYEEVSGGESGHREVVQVRYDPRKVTYAQLLDVFWKNVDPLDARGQFCDKGYQYTGAIYPATPEERRLAEASKRAVAARLKKPVVTAIEDATTFHEAEEYHQAYYKKNPLRYNFYRSRCGRDERLKELSGK